MVRYEFIKNKINDLKTQIALGISKPQVYSYLCIYEYYLSILEDSKMQAYSDTAERFRCSETYVRKIIKWMESN